MTTFELCQAFTDYIALWLIFAGDQNLLDEIIEHKSTCPICQNNMRLSHDLQLSR